jgi:hypothetical protein
MELAVESVALLQTQNDICAAGTLEAQADVNTHTVTAIRSKTG